jgi:hypothetical protein
VGDGTLIVENVTHDGRTRTITPPLVCTLCVQYDGQGYRWLQVTAPDDALGHLLSDEHNWEGPALSVVDRAEALERIGEILAYPETPDLVQNDCDNAVEDGDLAGRQRHASILDALRTRLDPPLVPTAEKPAS